MKFQRIQFLVHITKHENAVLLQLAVQVLYATLRVCDDWRNLQSQQIRIVVFKVQCIHHDTTCVVTLVEQYSRGRTSRDHEVLGQHYDNRWLLSLSFPSSFWERFPSFPLAVFLLLLWNHCLWMWIIPVGSLFSSTTSFFSSGVVGSGVFSTLSTLGSSGSISCNR